MRNRLVDPLIDLTQVPFRPQTFVVNGKAIPYMRLEIPFPVEDLLGWLEAQTLFPKVYFETLQEGAVAGAGCAVQLEEVPHFSEGEGPRFFGGCDFMKRKKKTWGDFPHCSYFLPLVEVEKREGGTYLCVNRVTEHLDLPLEPETSSVHEIELRSRLDSPSYPVWEREVEEVLKGIRQGACVKVVLARCTQMKWEGKVSPYALLKTLQGSNRFAFQFSKEKTFIGNSPETLYRRFNERIESAAIAGTRPRGKTPEEDVKLQDDLFNCPKERHEFQVVRDMVVSTLSPLCQSLQIDRCKVIQTSTVQHLHHHIEGILKEGYSDQALIEALHPTPAVGGYPREKSLEEIQKKETFDRGWYAAPVGFVSSEKSHHLVAIRSALVEQEGIRIFAGTGLVHGSTPAREWDELEHKISQYMKIL
ncbi:MAG: isochorismate synthase [Chlamydiia bacterium]|nr:isochorismate synthase [Chlamydiia bacterium]